MLGCLDNLLHVADLIFVGLGQDYCFARFPVNGEWCITFAYVVEMCQQDVCPLENGVD